MGAHSKPSRVRAGLRTAALGGAAATVAVAAQAAPAQALTPAPTVDWTPIIACESGGSATVVNSTGHGGLLQFSVSTWLRYGGGQYAARAELATPAQQIAVAEAAYAANGLNDWAASRSCWAGKVNVGGTTAVHAAAPVHTPAAVTTAKHASAAPAPKHAAPAAAAPRHAKVEVPAGVFPPHPNYTVKPGDTLWGIAVQHDWPDLYARNSGVVGSNPDLIFPGERLQV